MAGSLGELVLKVSAPADRFKRDFAQMSGTVNQFAGNAEAAGKRVEGAFAKMGGGRGLVGSLGQGFFQGLGIGSAVQGVAMLTREVGQLTSALAKAAIEGRSAGDALDSWFSNKLGMRGVTEMFDQARARSKAISELVVQAARDIDRAMGKAETPGQSRIDQFTAQIEALEKQKGAVTNQILKGLTVAKERGLPFQELGDLRIERRGIMGDIERLQLERQQFTKEIAAAVSATESEKKVADFAKKQADEMQRLADATARAQEQVIQRGASLMESLRTPQEQFNASVTDTLKLLEVGAINFQTYERAIAAAADQLKAAGAIKRQEFGVTGGVGAAEAGTSSGFSAVQSAVRQQESLSRQVAVQTQIERDQAATQKLILEAIRQGNEKLEAIGSRSKVSPPEF